jgi:hypothetical protein
MRTQLLQLAGRLLVTVVLVGCQERTTDPLQGGTEEQAASRPAMSPAISGAAGRTTVLHFEADGEFAQAVWTSEPDASGNFVEGSVLVQQGGSKSNPEVLLDYSVFLCDEVNGCMNLVQFGFGTIPTGDFTGNGHHGLKLHTETGDDPDFNVVIGTGGLISVEWDRIPGFTSLVHGGIEFKNEFLHQGEPP